MTKRTIKLIILGIAASVLLRCERSEVRQCSVI